MSVIEIRCPNCGSPYATKQGDEYVCNNCSRKFQIVTTLKKEVGSKGVVPQLKYGRVNFKIDQAKSLGNFVLGATPNLTYIPFQIFNYHAYKKTIKGAKPVIANEFGYVFVNPFTGTINTYLNKTNKLPEFNDCKRGIYQEAMKILSADALEDKPLMPMGNNPDALPLAKLQSSALSWIAGNLSVEKTYIQPTAIGRRRGDMGIRGMIMRFSKRDFTHFGSVGALAVPVFKLSYKHPNSTKLFKREIFGFSGEVFSDELRCSKTKMLGKSCDGFSDNVCSACGNLVCAEHSMNCEKCGVTLCKDCVTSKGVLSKHYYCSKCA